MESNSISTDKNKKEITEASLKKAIKKHNGVITEIAKEFGYDKNTRGIFYRRIEKYNINYFLKESRDYLDRVKQLIGIRAVEKISDIIDNIKVDKVSKQETVLLIFVAKCLSGFVELKSKEDEFKDDESFNLLNHQLEKARKQLVLNG